mmetsp:Transcript_7154/g.8262  ORF Transcript_7154/g.8262 Transcript_7154/m.8262 type:complete len:113 (-) Transcript_7154:357-695(-)
MKLIQAQALVAAHNHNISVYDAKDLGSTSCLVAVAELCVEPPGTDLALTEECRVRRRPQQPSLDAGWNEWNGLHAYLCGPWLTVWCASSLIYCVFLSWLRSLSSAGEVVFVQ